MYSQNNEDEIIFNYFKNQYPEKLGIGTMIEIGANDGKTFSNSLLFAENGWKCTLIEPSKRAFTLLEKLHSNKPNISLHNFGFAMFNGTQTFYESGAYRDGKDVALYSSLDKEEIEKWKQDVPFIEVEADFITWFDFRSQNHLKYDFISIDCEGFDLNLLRQMDLNQLGCECLCIEWNSDFELLEQINTECIKYGMAMFLKNPENVIYVKKKIL
jgi:FkbM family methyltransferase